MISNIDNSHLRKSDDPQISVNSAGFSDSFFFVHRTAPGSGENGRSQTQCTAGILTLFSGERKIMPGTLCFFSAECHIVSLERINTVINRTMSWLLKTKPTVPRVPGLKAADHIDTETIRFVTPSSNIFRRYGTPDIEIVLLYRF